MSWASWVGLRSLVLLNFIVEFHLNSPKKPRRPKEAEAHSAKKKNIHASIYWPAGQRERHRSAIFQDEVSLRHRAG